MKMHTQLLEIYSSASNAAVVRAPGRAFPGVVVQGDTLATMCHSAQALVDGIHLGESEELYFEAISLHERLLGLLQHYEATMQENGIPLPY